MELYEIEELLCSMEAEDWWYRKLSQIDPDKYTEPVHNWEELKSRMPEGFPDSPMTMIEPFLYESGFFAGTGRQVACFRNVRYCPPFLHKLDFIKIVYMLRGTSTFILDGKKRVLTEGNILIVSPGIEQAVYTGDDESAAINILLRFSTFTRTFSAILREQGIVSRYFWHLTSTRCCTEVLVVPSGRDERLRELVLKLYAEVHLQPAPYSLIEESYVGIFLGEMMRRFGDRIQVLEGYDDSVYRVPEILSAMQHHLQDITPQTLAGMFRISEEELRQELKQQTGFSYSTLLGRLRLQKAADLLQTSTLSIERIMEETGLNDSTAFYRSFKARFGMTPQQYRDGRFTITT